MRKLTLLLLLALAVSPALAETRSLQLTQDPRGPLNYDTSTKVTTLPGAVTSAGVTSSDMVVSTAGLPTIASGACGATTNGAVVAGSTNQTGSITIGSASTATCTVSFSKTLAVAPKACMIQPADTGSAAVGTTAAYISAITTGHFVITGTLASTTYYYLCM